MRGRDSTFSMLKQIASLPISDKASCNYGNYIQCELHALQNLKQGCHHLCRKLTLQGKDRTLLSLRGLLMVSLISSVSGPEFSAFLAYTCWKKHL